MVDLVGWFMVRGGGMAVKEGRLEEIGRSVCDELLSGGLA